MGEGGFKGPRQAASACPPTSRPTPHVEHGSPCPEAPGRAAPAQPPDEACGKAPRLGSRDRSDARARAMHPDPLRGDPFSGGPFTGDSFSGGSFSEPSRKPSFNGRTPEGGGGGSGLYGNGRTFESIPQEGRRGKPRVLDPPQGAGGRVALGTQATGRRSSVVPPKNNRGARPGRSGAPKCFVRGGSEGQRAQGAFAGGLASQPQGSVGRVGSQVKVLGGSGFTSSSPLGAYSSRGTISAEIRISRLRRLT